MMLNDLLTSYVNAENRMMRAPYALSLRKANDEIAAAKADQERIKQQIVAYFADMVDDAAVGHENATLALQRGSQAYRLANYAGSVLRGVAATMRDVI